MKQMLINAYLILSEDAKALSGEEWRDNLNRRKRMIRRSMKRYGMTIHELMQAQEGPHQR